MFDVVSAYKCKVLTVISKGNSFKKAITAKITSKPRTRVVHNNQWTGQLCLHMQSTAPDYDGPDN